MERFAKTYDYPYGNSYLSSYLYEPGKEIMENAMFERLIQRERDMRPFHIQCPITGKKVCFCKKQASFAIQKQLGHESKQSMLGSDYRRMAYELQLHYEGFPENIIERARDKM